MNAFFERLLPFLFLGVIVVIFVAGLILFSYLLIVGAIVGFILFMLAWLRDKFFPSKSLSKRDSPPRQGRTIDHDDISR
jgi:hypothetical protein